MVELTISGRSMRTDEDSAGTANATSDERLDVVCCSRGRCLGRLGRDDIERGFVILVAERSGTGQHRSWQREER
jgi:hypothetical protein